MGNDEDMLADMTPEDIEDPDEEEDPPPKRGV